MGRPHPGVDRGVVIVGSGMAGAQTAMALRRRKYPGTVTLVGAEAELPYQRPPLSKEYLKGSLEDGGLLLRPAQFWAEHEIELVADVEAVRIDRMAQHITLSDGRKLPYAHLVLALGAENRSLPGVPVPRGVLGLRTIGDARALRARLQHGRELVIVGGGFIGMEVAAAARERGARVTIIEAMDRIMARVLSEEMSQYFSDRHREQGVQILTACEVARFSGDRHVTGVELADGSQLPADTVLIGIGVSPNTELADACGLEVAGGIVVGADLLTADRCISAIGDCALFPDPVSGASHRLESIQNATDQAQQVAKRLTGDGAGYDAVPWFWSNQYDLKLQIAGVAPSGGQSLVRGDPAQGSFSVCRFDGDRLAAIESVNRPADHIAARKLIGTEAARRLSRDQLADPTVPLRSLVLSPVA
jgi:3-phenylpropionate/trans-cinnamate dioxygenase ferredoxin reductase subunit